MKGGSEYKVTNVPLNIDYQEVVAMAGVEKPNQATNAMVISNSRCFMPPLS